MGGVSGWAWLNWTFSEGILKMDVVGLLFVLMGFFLGGGVMLGEHVYRFVFEHFPAKIKAT